MTYPSKVDTWLAVVVSAALLASAVGLVAAGLYAGTWWPFILGCAVWITVGLFTVPVAYEITATELLVRGGKLWRHRIPLSEITSVLPSTDPLASPAWSLDRFEVLWAQERILISPNRELEFLGELRSRVPALEPRNGGLARPGT